MFTQRAKSRELACPGTIRERLLPETERTTGGYNNDGSSDNLATEHVHLCEVLAVVLILFESVVAKVTALITIANF